MFDSVCLVKKQASAAANSISVLHFANLDHPAAFLGYTHKAAAAGVAARPTHALVASPTAAQQVAAQKPANGAAAALLKNSRSTASNSP